jgi:hypothetical protein
MDVGAWLRGLGLGQYETTFRESEIDAELLPDLTEGDLNQLGVPLGAPQASPQGDRRSRNRGNRRQAVEPRACIVACDRRAPPDHSHVL